MALNLDIIGKQFVGTPFSYNEDDVILYALGIGAGIGELDFVYEKNLIVYPSFSIPMEDIILPMYKEAGITLAPLQGENKIIRHRFFPPSGTVCPRLTINSVYDKGDMGAVLNFGAEISDDRGRLLVEYKFAIIDRNAGNFGGDKGPKAAKILPPAGNEPDFRKIYTTSTNQAALFRLTGDKNPIHIDPQIARNAGFERPILHGMCTFGFAVRAIINSICAGDPNRFKSFSARFMNVVYPGDTLITEGWRNGEGTYIVQVKTQEEKIVLGNSIVEII
ncbi:MAG: MaoC/PaaZ C-terminal domain-containing protein [Pseudomonadota bacterium]